jgi:phosphoglycolate phosphatase-like HAD superfamily hydrolase
MISRIVLFDIDGTLIRPARRREYRQQIRRLLEEIFGTCGRIDQVDFAGKTDLAIYSEALLPEGITPIQIQKKLALIEAAAVELVDQMAAEICDGARQLLEALARDGRFAISLLTGNLEKLAEAKLRAVGLWHYFQLRGAFGNDHPSRDELPRIAARRINEQLGLELPPNRFIIVGDTPLDISCAKRFGAKAVAVASGKYTLEELKPHKPDALLESFRDTHQVIRLLAEI